MKVSVFAFSPRINCCIEYFKNLLTIKHFCLSSFLSSKIQSCNRYISHYLNGSSYIFVLIASFPFPTSQVDNTKWIETSVTVTVYAKHTIRGFIYASNVFVGLTRVASYVITTLNELNGLLKDGKIFQIVGNAIK